MLDLQLAAVQHINSKHYCVNLIFHKSATIPNNGINSIKSKMFLQA